MDIPTFLNGLSIQEFVEQCREPRKWLIQDMVAERTTTMIYGDTGIGKSTLVAQLLAQTSCGGTLFGNFEIPKPLTSVYFSFERPLDELGERLYHMKRVIPIAWNNLYLSDRFIGVDLLQEQHVKFFLESIRLIGKPIHMVYLDPIYASIRGGLSRDEAATAFTRVTAQITKRFGASVIWLHHTVKNPFEIIEGRKVRKDKQYYGGMWLEAHVNGSFIIEPTDNGTLWKSEKDSYRSLVNSISLVYDPSTYLSSILKSPWAGQKMERFIEFFNSCLEIGRVFTIRDLIAQVNMTDRYARELLNNPIVKDSSLVDFSEIIGKWTPIKRLSKDTIYGV